MRTSFRLHGREVATAFDLLGVDENAKSAAVGYALASSPVFRQSFVVAIGGPRGVEPVSISLQTARRGAGITDLEVRVADEFFAVVEAKRGAWLPGLPQLSQYIGAIRSTGIADASLVTLSDVPPEFARKNLPESVDGIPLRHLSWRGVLSLAIAAQRNESLSGRRVLRDLQSYLGELLGMDTLYSNRVFVVSLSGGGPPGWPLSFIDVVEKHKRYFYPVGKRWPSPPNYIAFRYGGRLQAIHHVESFSVFNDPKTLFRSVPTARWDDHYILSLGPAIRPTHPVVNGARIHRQNRCWCLLDTLLSSPSISDALTESERRIAAWAEARAV